MHYFLFFNQNSVVVFAANLAITNANSKSSIRVPKTTVMILWMRFVIRDVSPYRFAVKYTGEKM